MRPAGRLRVALFSPLRPERSGVADYTEDLLPHLAARLDIDLVVGPAALRTGQAVRAGVRVMGVGDFMQRPAAYDAVVYQVANHLRHHGYMLPCVANVPGVVVLHDCGLQYLMLGWTLGRGDLRGLERILRPQHGAEAASVARQLLVGAADPSRLMLAGPVIESSRYVIVHSEHARQRVLRWFPDKPVGIVPMSVPESHAEPVSGGLFGLTPRDFVVASISGLVTTKRLALLLRAVDALRDRIPGLKCIVAGTGSPGREAELLLDRLERAGVVVRTGWVSAGEYVALIERADVVVDMRYPSGSETSASLARALSAGRPLVVTDDGSFRELPDACAEKIPVGGDELARLEAARGALAASVERRRAMGVAARAYARTALTLDRAADAYVECLRAAARAPLPRVRWQEERATRARRTLVAAVYRACRVRHLYRQYGARHALNRVFEEARAARGGTA